jgi:hypothetical protein
LGWGLQQRGHLFLLSNKEEGEPVGSPSSLFTLFGEGVLAAVLRVL